MIDLMRFAAVRAIELVMGTSSIHLVNVSTATSRRVLPPFNDFLSGPIMSNSQVVSSSEALACGLLVNF